MTNITMLCANRQRLLKQELDSIGDLSDATVTMRDAGMNPDALATAQDWMMRKWNTESNNNICIKKGGVKLGTGPARNEVVHISEESFGRGKYLYLSDDDVMFLRPDWLSILIGAYRMAENYGYKVLAAYNHPFNAPIVGQQGLRLEAGSTRDPSTEKFDVWPVYAVATQSMLMSWDVWDE